MARERERAKENLVLTAPQVLAKYNVLYMYEPSMLRTYSTYSKASIGGWWSEAISGAVTLRPAITEVEQLRDVVFALVSIPCPDKVDLTLTA